MVEKTNEPTATEPFVTCSCGKKITVSIISQEDMDFIKKTHHPVFSCPQCGSMHFITGATAT